MTGEKRFAISGRIIGAVHRNTPKLKMFMISVAWSDGSEVIVYRSLDDFKKFHRQLKKRFPHMNPFRKNNRMIPKFMGKARRSSFKQKGAKRSVQRMKFLETYCDRLLKCDQSVTQSSEVTQFFMPKDHDLQPDFTKNSILILLSEDISDGSDGGGGSVHQRAASITHPFVTQTYSCVAAYETKDTKNRPFVVALDEKLDVLIKDPAGWWLVEKEDKRLAWFPAPYLQLWEGEEEDDSSFQLGGSLYCAVKSFSTKKEDEVSVPIGAVVEVLRKSDDGWWLIRFNSKVGYIPTMYLQPYNNPRAGLYSLQKKRHSSTLNLATSSKPQASHPPGIQEEISLLPDATVLSRAEANIPGRLQKARSLDALSETWSQTVLPCHAVTSERLLRSLSKISTDSSFTSFSSGSDSPSSFKEEAQHGPHPSRNLCLSDRRSSTNSSGSGSDSIAPRVPPRPKTEEILSRCTTMTRKAALATKTRLQIQPETIYSR